MTLLFGHGVLEKGVITSRKPFTLEGLGRKVKEVLDKEAPQPL